MVVLGRIVAPYGVRGWVKVHPLGDDPEAWCNMPQWWLGADADGSSWQPYRATHIGYYPTVDADTQYRVPLVRA